MSSSVHNWDDTGYVANWMSGDVQQDLLDLPRRISIALIRDSGIMVDHVVDLGSGPGRYLELCLEAFPAARGTWVDTSEPMLKAASVNLSRFGDRVRYLLGDASAPRNLHLDEAPSVVVTSRMVHHFDPSEVTGLYSWVRSTLKPGGWFFNLDHIAAPGEWEVRYRAIKKQFTPPKPDRKERKAHRHDHPYNSSEQHLEWLLAAGFETPDVSWRMFYSALMGARRLD